jgi:hypothetical protein
VSLCRVRKRRPASPVVHSSDSDTGAPPGGGPSAPAPPRPGSSGTRLYGDPRRFKGVFYPSALGSQTAAIPRGPPSRSEKCGYCSSCKNPRWKKACVTARTHSLMSYAITGILGERLGPTGKRQLCVAWAPGFIDEDMVDAPILTANYDARCAARGGPPHPSEYSDMFPPEFSNSSDADPSVASDSSSADEQTSEAVSGAGDAVVYPSWVGYRTDAS